MKEIQFISLFLALCSFAKQKNDVSAIYLKRQIFFQKYILCEYVLALELSWKTIKMINSDLVYLINLLPLDVFIFMMDSKQVKI